MKRMGPRERIAIVVVLTCLGAWACSGGGGDSSSPDNPDEHLQAMETIFKHVQRDIFRKFLRQAQTKQAILDLIHEADELLG